MIDGTTETVNLRMNRFRDAEDLPTCLLDYIGPSHCTFFRVQRFGLEETCIFAPAGAKRLQTLSRRGPSDESLMGSPNMGSLIPGDYCPLFKMKDGEEHE